MSRRIVSAAYLLAAILFIVFAPSYFSEKLGADPYREWLMHKEEPSVGVITVWHIVSFKPYVGSLGSWLKERAKEYSDRYVGVYFDVKTYSENDAALQLSRGSRPDVISFAGCMRDNIELYPYYVGADEIRTPVYAAPYCASGMLLLYDPVAAQGTEKDALIVAAGTAEEFRSGKKKSCICDIRGTGDLCRAQIVGKCPFFEAEPLIAAEPLVQYIGLCSGIDEAKLPYAKGFIDHILCNASQKRVSSLGLIPVNSSVVPEYDTEWLRLLYDSIDIEKIPYL